MQSSSSLLCSTAAEWLTPTLDSLPTAAILLRADDESGTIIYQNQAATNGVLLHQYKPTLSEWNFLDSDWNSLSIQLGNTSGSVGGGGCPVRHHPSLTATVQIPILDTPPQVITIQFHLIQTCSCGCQTTYVVAYLTPVNTRSDAPLDDHSSTLLESCQRLQATMDASFDAMFTINQKGTIVLTNQAAVKLFGYHTVDDFIGQNVSMLCGAEHASSHDTYLQRYLQTGVAKIMGTQRRVLAVKKDGTEFPIELGIVELPSSSQERFFSGFVRDLTTHEEQEAKILVQANLTQALMNASFDPMIQINQQGIIQVCNEATINLLGYSRDEIIGANISILCGGDHGAHHDEYMQRYMETGQKRVIGRKRPTVARRKDGSEFPIELGVKEVRLENGELAFCGFLRDLTSQTKLKESLQRQGQLIHSQFFGGTEEGSDVPVVAATPSSGDRPRRPKRDGNQHCASSPIASKVLRDWWSEADSQEYEKRLQVIIDQADNFVVYDKHVNGNLTAGENVADLGGLRLALRALTSLTDFDPEQKIDGFTSIQRFFLSYAQSWRENITKELALELLMYGSHAPSELRVNLPLSNMPEFQEAFDIPPDSPMFVPLEDRIYLKCGERVCAWLKRSIMVQSFNVLIASLVATTCTTTIWGFIPSQRLAKSSTAMFMADFTLDPEKTAFVFIEYQNEFASPGGKLYDAVKDLMEKTNMLEKSSNLANFAREKGCTIIHCPISFDDGHSEISANPYGILAGVKEGAAFTNGSWGADFCPTMRPQPGDLVAKGKSGLCGFESTNLDFLLRQKKAENVVLGGFLTNCCVESTMRSAYEKGYKVYTLKDCVAATSMEAQEATLQHNFGMFSIPTTSDDIKDAILC